MAYDELVDKYQRKKYFPKPTFTQGGLFLLLLFGFYLLISNSYNLYASVREKASEDGYTVNISPKYAWIYAKHVCILTIMLSNTFNFYTNINDSSLQYLLIRHIFINI